MADIPSKALPIYKRLLRYALPYWRSFLLAVVGMIGFAGADTYFMYLMKPLLDEGFSNPEPQAQIRLPLIIMGLFVIRGLSGYLSAVCMAQVGRNVIFALREHIFAKLLALPTAFYDATSTGQLVSMVTFNTEQVMGAVTNSLTVMIRDTLHVLGLLGLLFYLDASLALFTLIVGPLIAVVVRQVAKRFRRYAGRVQNVMGRLTQVVEQAILGQQVIKVFGGQQREMEGFDGANRQNRKLTMRMVATNAASNAVVQLIAAVAVAMVVYFAIGRSIEGSITAGTFAAFMAAAIGVLTPLKRLTNLVATLQKGIAAAESIFELLDTPAEADKGQQSVSKVKGQLHIQQLSYAYDVDKGDVLSDISLSIAPGETLALVGSSGSGKSTLASLLPRFYNIERGQMLLDGQDIRDLPLAELRRNISYVSQSVMLFDDSIRRNIAYGELENATDEQIEAVARQAYAWDFIQDKPDGLDYEVGENGSKLSGGQRQRLAIARALLKDAPVLILDEATAALDTESERHIQSALDALMKNRTTLVIAHRLSTIENADRIAVLEQGRIVEVGNHQELLAKNGRYASLYRLQFGES